MSNVAAPIFSVIVPLYNSAEYLEQSLESVLAQQQIDLSSVQLIVYNDASTDDSLSLANRLEPHLSKSLFRYTVLSSAASQPSGVGSARNRCCEVALADNFVFLDSDDLMHPTRLARTVPLLESHGIVGGNFERIPSGSTPRYEAFHRRVKNSHIESLVYAFRDAPVPMPTVACTRTAFNAVGGFVEGRGVSEDLHFMYAAIERGIPIAKVDGESLTMYRYHQQMTSLSLTRDLLMSVRVAAFERIILSRTEWKGGFSVWGAGRDGKQFYKNLSDAGKLMIRMWGDIDPNKIGKQLRSRPVVHWSELRPPIAICVAMDRDGVLEKNIEESAFVGGRDYFHLV